MTRPPAFRRFVARALHPGKTLLVVSVLLPLALFGLAAAQGRRDVLREARNRVERTLAALNEHAVKVFETDRLVIEAVNGRLRFVNWDSEGDRADLAVMLTRLERSLEQVTTITVVGPDGRLRASSRAHPVDPTVSFADRDWFSAVRDGPADAAYVSGSYLGRQSGQLVFNLAAPAWSPDGRFAGAVAVSVDRAYLQAFYRSVEPDRSHATLLVRDDGQVLARDPPVGPEGAAGTVAWPIPGLPPGAKAGRVVFDGRDHVLAHRQVGDYPLHLVFAVPTDVALAPWRDHLVASGITALLAMGVLLGVSGLAIHHARRERVARFRWQDTAAKLEAEAANRSVVEEQLRQSQKMEAVGRLTGGVAHDFNNLLTVVIGSLDLLRRRVGLDERALRLVGGALDGANRAATLTHRLLAFSRQQPLDPKPVDVNAMLDGMADMLFRTLGEDVAVEIVREPDLWPVFADPHQFENAVLNLAVNARDAMEEGGRLAVMTGNRPGEGPEGGDAVAVAVRDTGTGMTPDVLAKAFDPFFTTKPVGRGTGLGLSQVYGFARQSGGHVSIDTEPGRGTTVTIRLPRHRSGAGTDGADAPGTPVAEGEARGRGETVLVVEDDAAVRGVGRAMLEGAGFRVVTAAEGPAALDALRAHPEVALLFTDVVLTGPLNGRRLADEAVRLRPGLPVLFTTGYTRDAIVRDGRIEEGIDLIGKPFTAATLTGRIRDMLDRRSAAAA